MRTPQAASAPRSPRSPDKNRPQGKKSSRSGSGREGGAGWIWVIHAVKAELANPKRTIHDIIVTENTLARLSLPQSAPPPKIGLPAVLDRDFGPGHQGIALKAAPLEWPDLETFAAETSEGGLILVLDQITDPHNVGAMLRLCSAFGAQALVMQTRKAPPLSGAVAKVAVGCVETVPVCHVTNIANTLQSLQKDGWIVTGLAGETELDLAQALGGHANHVTKRLADGKCYRVVDRDRLRSTLLAACDRGNRPPTILPLGARC